ncbi:hypothetical protein ASPZODRAFT_153293 [Penicilliopsis zonata CBS 506.65]|uniref:Ketoreductase (KR) domain-containing protein n=1 Tax=Penicilliopsis zonata CBS 506.65 TaxID=1073090 RepID=A0A1L9SCV4_9EURO|nr:hypothetical protein ASPZODRAFT_153293 [Penicilliopsis zonata CBS 506.65]OJJ44969.1 hypothetical protein ASPZODRAFT_153293 [Penicilliopsis zonata CBS 506.65]
MATQDLEAHKLFQVEGYVAVVTGGGTGIGLMAAQTLAANGARVYIIGRRKDVLEAAAMKYSSKGEIVPLPGDISHPDGIQAIADLLSELESSGINILINNAGAAPEHTAKHSTSSTDLTSSHAISKWMIADGVSAWHTSYVANVASHHFLTASLLPLLDKAKEAAPGHTSCVINIASVAGLTKTHSMGQFAYSSSKAALIHLTREWAHTFLPLQVRVNCLAPGLFPSEMSTETRADENQKSRFKEGVGSSLPAGRVGCESDIGSVILWLASRAGTYVNGQVVHVDGGVYCLHSLLVFIACSPGYANRVGLLLKSPSAM